MTAPDPRVGEIEARANNPFSPDNTRAQMDADRDHLLARLDAIEALHAESAWKPGQPRPAESDTLCAWCGTVYPCPTITALTGEGK